MGEGCVRMWAGLAARLRVTGCHSGLAVIWEDRSPEWLLECCISIEKSGIEN